MIRFILNYNQKHPMNSKRLSLNYEIVILVMPSVYLGSMIGVLIGSIIGNIA